MRPNRRVPTSDDTEAMADNPNPDADPTTNI
jgi:hypothetical protein